MERVQDVGGKKEREREIKRKKKRERESTATTMKFNQRSLTTDLRWQKNESTNLISQLKLPSQEPREGRMKRKEPQRCVKHRQAHQHTSQGTPGLMGAEEKEKGKKS